MTSVLVTMLEQLGPQQAIIVPNKSGVTSGHGALVRQSILCSVAVPWDLLLAQSNNNRYEGSEEEGLSDGA